MKPQLSCFVMIQTIAMIMGYLRHGGSTCDQLESRNPRSFCLVNDSSTIPIKEVGKMDDKFAKKWSRK